MFSSNLQLLDMPSCLYICIYIYIYGVFDEESDYQVKNIKSDGQRPKNRKTEPRKFRKDIIRCFF